MSDRLLATFVATIALAVGCIIFYVWFGHTYPDGPKVFVGYEVTCGEQYGRTACSDVPDTNNPIYEQSRAGLGYPKWVETVDEFLLLLWWILGISAFVALGQFHGLRDHIKEQQEQATRLSEVTEDAQNHQRC